jgi:pantothenate kinase type III
MATLYDTSIEFNGVEYGICGIDMGNSRVKIYHDDVFVSLPYDKDWKKHLQHHFRDQTSRRYLIGLSSVNPKQTTGIVKVLQRCPGHQVLNAHVLLMRNSNLLDFGNVENAGIDRLLGTIGALNQQKPPLLTIDCGTAVTINVVNSKRDFLGGVIFAGLSTQLYGLSRQTAALPNLPYSVPKRTIGVNTQDCLMSGVTAAAIGGCVRIVEQIFAEQFDGTPVPIVVSGGEGEGIAEGLEKAGLALTYYPHLVTDGVLQLLAHATLHNIADAIIGKLPR